MQKEEETAPKLRFAPTALDALDVRETHDTAPVGWRSPLPRAWNPENSIRDVARLAWRRWWSCFWCMLASLVDLAMVGALGPWAISPSGLPRSPNIHGGRCSSRSNVGVTAWSRAPAGPATGRARSFC
jgi:hypothetical protein